MIEQHMVDTKLLPLGRLGFSNIRKRGKIYVDKTKLICKLAEQDIPFFLSRPRRFGKSLLINTIHSLFERGLEDFSGLEIEKKWSDTTYKVVHIDFSRMIDNNIYDLKFTLSKKIIQQFSGNDFYFKFDTQDLQYPDMILDEMMQKISDYSLVMLIDEYDAPLIHNINNHDFLKDVENLLNKFYLTIKQYTDKFRFIFITGIIKASYVSLFSSFNNLIDLSLDDDYNSLLWFTQEELKKYFDQYVEQSSRILNMSKNDVYQRLEQYYDGFQFSINVNETVYNPWSILNFFNNTKNGFDNFWFESGGTPSIIR